MPKFDGSPYTQLTNLARGDVQGVIKDISESLPENKTKYATYEDILKFGPWASKVRSVTASSTIALSDTDPIFIEIDPNGANRDVSCPTKSDDNHGYFVHNIGSLYTLTVKRSEGTTIAIVPAGQIAYIKPSTINDFSSLYDSKGREVLTANRIYYVRADGNDSNTGLANTSGGAFLTIQKAVDTAAGLDLSIYDIYIQLGTGTWTENVILKNAVGAGTIIIQGDLVVPNNAVVRSFAKSLGGTKYTIQHCKFVGSSTLAAIDATNGALVSFGNVEFSTGYTYHLQSTFGAKIECDSSYSISGGSSAHVSARGGGVSIQGRTITLTGTPAFGTIGTQGFVECRYPCVVFINGNTFSGSATGRRYYVDYNAVVQSVGATLPGNVAGAFANGGIYA